MTRAACTALILAAVQFSAVGVTAEAAEAPKPERGISEIIRGKIQDRIAEKHVSYAERILKKAADLKLSDEQIGKITRIQQESKPHLDELARSAFTSMKVTHELFLNPASDDPQIRKSAESHNAAFSSLVEESLKARTAINAVLTPDQLAKLKSLKSD